MIYYQTPVSNDGIRQIEAFVEAHNTLERLITTHRAVVSMLQQDEFSSDVVVKYDENVHLVYQVT
jgi:hypothetical protein